MSDFEDRVGRALGGGAEDAPAAHGLAAGARRRLRARRQRFAVAGVAVAVVAVVVPLAVIAGNGPDGRDDRSGTDVINAPSPAAEDPLVTCGGEASWPVSVMDSGLQGGLPAGIDDAQVRAVLARVLDDDWAAQPYVVLAADADALVIGTGDWSSEAGPARGAVLASFRVTKDERLEPTGTGGCRLEVAVPEGRDRVEVTAPEGGVDASTTSPEVLVSEIECTSARDPRPYLGAPDVVETDDRVLVTLTSEASAGGDCPSNPRVPLTLQLDQPLGDRQLYDAGTWPPTPIRVAPAAEQWQTIAQDHARAELPPGWHEVDCDFGGGDRSLYGPTDVDPCEFGAYAAFYGGATYDAAQLPGVLGHSEEDGEVRWSGYVYAGDWVLSAASPDRDLTLRILASARTDGQPVVVADRWAEGAAGDVEWRYPTSWGVDGDPNPSYGVEVTARPAGERVQQSPPEQLDEAHVRMYGDIGARRITVTAPSQAVAELVLSSTVADEG